MNRKISQADLDATTRYDLHTRLEGMPKHNKVCHGDFRPSNVIISEDGTPYVIDWSHATQGNASADAARTYLLLLAQGRSGGCGKVSESVLRAQRHRQALCAKVDAHRGRQPVRQGQRARA